MKELIAKKYVKALLEIFGQKELEGFLSSLSKVSALYKVDKFQLIIQSPDVSKQQKLDFLLSMVDKKDSKMVNFIKLLNENDRLLLIPTIKEELENRVSQMENIHQGMVLSDWEIGKEDLAKLEQGFSKKFGATVKLAGKKTDYPGIKIELDTLGVEASFSVERLKAQISEHILKAI